MSSALDEKVWIAEAIIRFREKRAEVLPSSLFAEHPWDALLHLFVADAHSDRLTGNDLADRTGSSRTVMSRWVKYLSEQRLIDGDGRGEMDVTLVLSHKALDAIELFLTDVQGLAAEFLETRDQRSRAGERPI